ncbi:MAG: host attachment protein [Phenylobacterium sp.]|uniref:host attachment protein n=1 Tax=Phenylobacterium sp. TaxID=1871053 RepID=UPI001A4E8E7B|nr:host attachment protein [Phenylobacterium sp.]MBL8774270.1 host attachment protein [Phenylobacterium sp.]
MILEHGDVVAVVDGAKFELYRNQGTEIEPVLSRLPTPVLRETNKSGGAHHYTSSGNPSGHLLEEDAHAAAVVDWLNQQVLGHKIARLVVIAAPRTLGEMRRHYHKALRAAVLSEFPRDVAGRGEQAVLRTLKET